MSAEPIRVMVVDDAVVVRRLVTNVLERDPTITVAATAANGRIALQKLERVNPDLVVLDIEMPEMDGLAALESIRARRPRLPVIMFSTLTERGAAATLDALARGASDYVTKPSNTGSFDVAAGQIEAQLVPKIKALCGRTGVRPARGTGSPRPTPPVRLAAPSSSPAPVTAVVVGVSTGGPTALLDVVPRLPRDFPVPILIVQHMPPTFTRLLAERLDARSAITVVEAQDGGPVTAGSVVIAQGGRHMALAGRAGRLSIRLTGDPPENSCRPAVDVLFRSAAGLLGAGVLAVVLTGMGHDGRAGGEVIARAGGSVIAQDEASSVVWGMPGSIARAGLASALLPLDQIAPEIIRRVRHRAAPPPPAATPEVVAP
jgi:two-component system chemotaxis response regulator CheB